MDFGRRVFICSNQNLNSSGTFGCRAIAHGASLLVGLRSLTLKAAIIFSVIKVAGSARLPPPADTLSVKRSECFRRADERFSHGNRCYKLFETQMSDRRAFDDGMPRRANSSVETDAHEAMILRNWPSASRSHRWQHILRQFHPTFNEHSALALVTRHGS